MTPATPTPPPSRLRLYALLWTMLLVWSANFLFTKTAMRSAPGLLVITARTVLSGIFITPIYALDVRRRETARAPGIRRWSWADAPRLLTIGLLGAGNQMVFAAAMGHTSVAHGSVVCALGPLLVMTGAILSGQERLRPRNAIGMLSALLGIAVLQLGALHGGRPSFGGDALMLTSALLFAAFTILGKRAAHEFGSLTVNFFAFAGGGLLSSPVALWALARGAGQTTPLAWIAIAYMALFSSVVGYLIYAYALRYLPASHVSSISYLQPIGATLLAIPVLGERPGLSFLPAVALVVGGVWLAQRR